MRLYQIKDKLAFGPQSREMARYLDRKRYIEKQSPIEYNREYTPERNGYSYGYRTEPRRWVEHPSHGLRFVGKVHEIRGSGDGRMPYFDRSLIDHTGWFTNQYQDETIWGEVYQLPSRDGKEQYVAAVSDPNNDGATINFRWVTDDLIAAIRAADSMAENDAELEREYQAKEAAKMRCEDIDAEILTLREGLKALCNELRANCDKLTGMDVLKQTIRAEVKRVRAKVRRLRLEHAKLTDDFWLAVEN